MGKLIKVYIDSNRDGQVSQSDFGQASWIWGKDQHGAILMPNKDRDLNELAPEPGTNSELSIIKLEPVDPFSLDGSVTLHAYASENAARRFTIYRKTGNGKLEAILGVDNNDEDNQARSISKPLSVNGETLYIESNQIPGEGFEGLITVEFFFLKDGKYLWNPSEAKKIIFRVAPWIMTPNTQRALKVFTVKVVNDNATENSKFLEGLKAACDEAHVPLHIIDGTQYHADRWIQDEIEFGYCQTPSHTIPVVFDSPRDRGLDDFAENELLGADFGHFSTGNVIQNSLDSMGNLEVSPPVVVKGKEYPFGRIVFGGKKIGVYNDDDRQMMPMIKRMLYAQKVQSPIELYSDWLAVAHVDEFLNFIPDPTSSNGFKLLLASSKVCLEKLQELKDSGHGDVVMFEGRHRLDLNTGNLGESAEITISDFLSDSDLVKWNNQCQENIDFNESILIDELGLSSSDIIYAPVLFFNAGGRALAYFPDMVNHLVINDFNVVPKPYGPIIEGKDVFEEMMINCLPTGRKVRFIDDWYSYHEVSGEVHCGTNTLREPFVNKKWWEYKPDGGFNI